MWPFKKKEFQILDIPPTGYYDQEIVGESFYQKSLKKICGRKTKEGHRKEVKAILYCDNKNSHDDKAVACRIDGSLVGHLSRSDARDHRKALEKQGVTEAAVRCSAIIVGGWSRKLGKDTGDFGVKLDLGPDE